MLKKEFVPHEQALALKELGFDEPCFKKYIAGCLWSNPTTPEIYENIHSNSSDCLAPLYQQAFRWFREKYKLQHHIWSGKINSIFYGYDILNIEEQEFVVNNSDISGGDCDYETYEEAELVCVIKLIEIVKTKKNK